MHKPLIVLAAILLGGCASTTPLDLQTNKGTRFEADIHTNVATAYRQTVQQARQCFNKVNLKIEADYFPDVNQASIALSLVGNALTFAAVTVKIEPTSKGTGHMIGYYSGPGTEWIAQSFTAWANGLPGQCKV